MAKREPALVLQKPGAMKRIVVIALSTLFLAACGVGYDEAGFDDPSATQTQALGTGSPPESTVLPRSNPRALPQDPIPEMNERKPKQLVNPHSNVQYVFP